MLKGQVINIILAAFVVLLVFLYSKKSKGKSSTAFDGLDIDKLLYKGVKGKEVKKLQELLLKEGYHLPIYGVDGDFGNETQAALMLARGVSEISLKDFIS